MRFELTTPTNCRLTKLISRTEKAGKKDIPAISYYLKLEGVENLILDMLSPTFRLMAYAPVEGQETLPGVPITTPILRSKDLKRWAPEELAFNGWNVTIEHGIDESSAIQSSKVKIDAFACDLFEGGRVDLEFRCSTSDIDSEGVGVLWASQKQIVSVLIKAPEIAKGDRTEATGAQIDGTTGHPGADSAQGSLLDADAVTPESALAGSMGNPDGQEVDPDDEQDGDGPVETEGGRTGAAGFEAGAPAAIEKAGVAPKGSRRGRRPAAEVH